jgi:hypothetical protein
MPLIDRSTASPAVGRVSVQAWLPSTRPAAGIVFTMQFPVVAGVVDRSHHGGGVERG